MNIMLYIKKKMRVVRKSFKDKVRKCEEVVPTEIIKKDRFMFYKAYLFRDLTPDEFIKYRFWEKKPSEKEEYLSYSEQKDYYLLKNVNLFPRSKYKRYLIFKSFFRRDMICVASEESDSASEEEYQSFCENNRQFIVKPIAGLEGRGVIICSRTEAPNLSVLQLKFGKELLLEGLINQGQELAIFHPNSVNTIRFVSGLSPEGHYSIIYALLRIGRGGAVVDNVGSGGLVALIDITTGVVCSDALCGMQYYEKHPDTNIPFRGTVIPQWETLCKLSEEAHRSFPEQRLIGWDFAWTLDQKWDLVEANPCPSFISVQALTGKGIIPLLKEAGIWKK